MALTTKMSKDEFNTHLKRFNLSAAEACNLVYNHTGVVIAAKRVTESVDRYGLLGAPMTALFRYLFKRLETECPTK